MVESVRTKRLSFYSKKNRNTVIAEVKPKYETGAYYFVTITGQPIAQLLCENGGPVHKIYEQLKLNLSTADQVRDYLKFFTSSIAGDKGIFQLADPQSTHLTAYQKTVYKIKPVTVQKQTNSKWSAAAHMVYDNTLCEAQFVISRNGKVEMASDKPLGKLTPSYVTSYVGQRRVTQRIANK